MANPEFIPISFAKNGQKNSIYKTLQPSQYEGALTWDKGAPPITMIYKEDGGLPPDGKDFNGVLFTLSDHAVHRQNGNQILWSQDVIDNFGGYAKDCIIQSDDGTKHFRSLIDNNIYNPNTQAIANRWEIYAGVGSIPVATSTTAGVTKVLNNLVTNDPSSALSAAMGLELSNKMFTVGQTVKDLSGLRFLGATYRNTTGKVVFVTVCIDHRETVVSQMTVNGVVVSRFKQDVDAATGYQESTHCYPVPAGATYSVTGGTLIFWKELS